MSPRLAATLFFGLSDDSRAKQRLNRSRIPPNSVLIAAVIDAINGFRWMLADEESRGEAPKSVLESFFEKLPPETFGFASGEDFEKFRRNLLNGGETYG